MANAAQQDTQPLPSLPDRPIDGHKGTFGTVIVVGGCRQMIGAPAIATRAAFRVGAGLVKIATDATILPQVLSVEPHATGIGLKVSATNDPETLATNRKRIAEADMNNRAIYAMGPGLQKNHRDLLPTLYRRDCVIDADALNQLAMTGQRLPALPENKKVKRILTPHPGEYQRLAKPFDLDFDPTDPKQRPQAAMALAAIHNAIVLLKGQNTIIATANQYRINTTGNPALSVAGSGDVLTGAIAGMLAQGMNAYAAASLACHLHGRAAELLVGNNRPVGLRATELADGLCDAINAYAADH